MRRATLALLVCACSSVSAAACAPKPDLPHMMRVPAFALHDQNGRAVSTEQLSGKVWIANFIFTRCPDMCPLLTSRMAGVRTQLAPVRSQVQIVSFSVDPAHDTPAVLKDYAQKHDADQPDWTFLTGAIDQVKQLDRRRLQAKSLRPTGGGGQGLRHPARQSLRVGRSPTRHPRFLPQR